MFRDSSHKGQSAMEYLMTYGWAILIIAVVLTVLFSLGLFNGNTLVTNACAAQPGFLCSSSYYNHQNANILVTIGQSTSQDWTAANFVFIFPGTPYNQSGVPSVSWVGIDSLTNPGIANSSLYGSGLQSGNQAKILIPVNGVTIPVAVGSPITGSIWAQYWYTALINGREQSLGPYYTQVASINIKAS